MEVLEKAGENMSSAAQATEYMNNVWNTSFKQDQDDMNSKDQGLMLDEVREAINDMAQLVSMNTASGEVAFTGGVEQSESSAEKAPTLIGDESQQASEREVEETLIALLANIERAATVEDLEKIHEIFSAHAQVLKGRIALTHSRKLLETYLSIMATLSVLSKQIDIARQNNVTQINGKLIAEQISQRLIQSQQAIRLARETSPGARVLSTNSVVHPYDAAFANAVMGHGLVREDMHAASVSHLGVA